MNNLMNELTTRRDLLYKKLKINNDKEIYEEYKGILRLIDSINIVLKVGTKIEDIDKNEFNDLKENAFSNPVLDPIYPYIYSVDFLLDDAEKYADKDKIYKYISDEIDDSSKFNIN